VARVAAQYLFCQAARSAHHSRATPTGYPTAPTLPVRHSWSMTSAAWLTWPQVHAWRLQRHFAGGSTVAVVRRLGCRLR